MDSGEVSPMVRFSRALESDPLIVSVNPTTAAPLCGAASSSSALNTARVVGSTANSASSSCSRSASESATALDASAVLSAQSASAAAMAVADSVSVSVASRMVAIAPEGTRSLTGQMLDFKKGPFYLWESMNYPPLHPLVVMGAYELMPPPAAQANPRVIDAERKMFLPFDPSLERETAISRAPSRMESGELVNQLTTEVQPGKIRGHAVSAGSSAASLEMVSPAGRPGASVTDTDSSSGCPARQSEPISDGPAWTCVRAAAASCDPR